MIKKAIRLIYYEMQKHYVTFRFLVWLKERGITRRVNFWIMQSGDKKENYRPTNEMQKSKAFCEENKDRIENVLKLLSDEKSKMVWGGGYGISN